MNLIFHLIFIIIYTTTMTRELKKKESFELHQALESKFTAQTFRSFSSSEKSFDDLSSVEDIIDWMNNIYLTSIFQNYADTSTTDTTILPIYGQNKIISSSVTRITIRNTNVHPETSSDNTVFYLRDPINLSPSSGQSNHEVTDRIIFNSTYSVQYHEPGSRQTSRKKGGFAFALPRDKSGTQSISQIIQHPKLININTALITLEAVYMNANYEIQGICEFTMGVKASGRTYTESKTRVFQIDIYGCDGCSSKIVLQIFYLLFVLKQTFDLIKSWIEEWKKKESQKITPVKSTLKHRGFAVRLLNYDAPVKFV